MSKIYTEGIIISNADAKAYNQFLKSVGMPTEDYETTKDKPTHSLKIHTGFEGIEQTETIQVKDEPQEMKLAS